MSPPQEAIHGNSLASILTLASICTAYVFSHMLDFSFLKDRATTLWPVISFLFSDDLQLSVDMFMSVGSSNLKDSSHSFSKYCFSVLPLVYTIKQSHSSHHVSYWLFSFFTSFCLRVTVTGAGLYLVTVSQTLIPSGCI